MDFKLPCLVLALSLIGTAQAADSPQRPSASANGSGIPFFLFSQTQVSFTYAADARYPNTVGGRAGNSLDGRSVPANVMTINHVNAWEYGTNLLDLDVINNGSQRPAGTGLPNPQVFENGSTIYNLVYRGTLSGNALTGSGMFTVPGWIKDVSVAYGVDHENDNSMGSLIGARAVAGLNVAFDVPAGFINVSVLAQQTWSRWGILPPPFRNTESDVTARVEVAYTLPLVFTNLPLSIAGFATYNPPRGPNPFGGNLKAEFLSRTDLVLDVGALAFNDPNRLKAFVGFLYWHNSHGENGRITPGTDTATFLAGVSVTVF